MKVYHHEQSAEEKAASKRGKRSRRKGHDFERDIVRRLNEGGLGARRGLQAQTGKGCADVQLRAAGEDFHCECKVGARPNIHAAIYQAIGDAPSVWVPVAITKKDRDETLVTMLFDDWLNLLSVADDGENEP